MRCRQANTITPIKGSWVIDNYLASCLKNTELHSIIFDIDITNNAVGAIEATDVLDLINVRLTRDGNNKLVDCSMGDLLRIGMIKHKTNYGDVGSVAGGGGTFACEVVLPIADKSRPNPEDTAISVNTLKSLQLEIQDNNTASQVLAPIETMITFQNQKNSLRINSDRYILKSGVVIGGAVNQQSYPLQECLRTLALVIGTLTNLSYLSVDGGDETIFDGEPDELVAFSRDALELNPPDTAFTSAGVDLTTTCIPLPFLGKNDGYGKGKSMPVNFRFTTAGAITLNILEDYIVTPNTKKVNEYTQTALPFKNLSSVKAYAVGKNGSKLTADKTAKATIVPQVKINTGDTIAQPLSRETSDINLEAMTSARFNA